MFKLYDTTKDNFIDLQELKYMMEKLGCAQVGVGRSKEEFRRKKKERGRKKEKEKEKNWIKRKVSVELVSSE